MRRTLDVLSIESIKPESNLKATLDKSRRKSHGIQYVSAVNHLMHQIINMIFLCDVQRS